MYPGKRDTRIGYFGYVIIVLCLSTIGATSVFAQGSETLEVDSTADTGWTAYLEGSGVRQFETDVDGGGTFTVNRFAVGGVLGYTTESRKRFLPLFSYGFSQYHFSGTGTFAGAHLWDNIHSLSLAAPLRFQPKDDVTAFVVPLVRMTGETGADAGDAISGGGLAGFSYRVNERLSIGPGAGVLTQIEDSATFFPVLLVNWKITERLTLRTDSDLTATLGPGLELNWKANEKWDFSVGGRSSRLRFRLDDKGAFPDGVGEDSSFPIYGEANYSVGDLGSIGLIGGVELGGELRLEDKTGDLISKEDYDPAGFIGLKLSTQF